MTQPVKTHMSSRWHACTHHSPQMYFWITKGEGNGSSKQHVRFYSHKYNAVILLLPKSVTYYVPLTFHTQISCQSTIKHIPLWHGKKNASLWLLQGPNCHQQWYMYVYILFPLIILKVPHEDLSMPSDPASFTFGTKGNKWKIVPFTVKGYGLSLYKLMGSLQTISQNRPGLLSNILLP